MSESGRIGPWALAGALVLALSPLLFVHPVRISGRSMTPLLHDEEIRLAIRAWCAGEPSPGQIWIVRAPEGPIVKRLVALPHSRVAYRDGELWINDHFIDEPYVPRYERGSSGTWDTGDAYFFLGDNRTESRDSRTWGALPRERLEGRIWIP